MEDPQPIELVQILRQFMSDVRRTFPEYASCLEEWEPLSDEDPAWTTRMIPYLTKVYPPHFFNIVFKTDGFFQSDTPLWLFPNIDFRQLYNAPNVTEDIQSTLWEYVHAILFKLIPFVENKQQFQDAAYLFDSVPDEELESRFQQVFENNPFINPEDMTTGSDDVDAGGDDAGGDAGGDVSDSSLKTARMKQLLEKLMGSKLGQLSKTLMEELKPELEEMFPDLDLNSETTQSAVFKRLLTNPSKLISLVKRAKGKLEEKMKRGEITKEELVEDMTEMMKDADLKREMENMMKQMGVKGGLNQSGLKTEMSKSIQRNRMRNKLNAKKQTEFFHVPETASSSDSGVDRPPPTDAELEEIIRELERPVVPKSKKKSTCKK